MPSTKRKLRKVRPVIYIHVEGYVEDAFLTCLRSYYHIADYKINIDNRRGGDPNIIINHACNECNDTFRTAVFIDDDKPVSQEAYDRATRCNVKIIQNSPCIEGTLLNILEIEYNNDSNLCKKNFNEIIGERNRTFNKAHTRLFPKDLLDQRRQSVDQLDRIIRIMQGEDI
ncbi:hypothetical protein ACQKFL_11430 [Vreelandella titanicae]|uniref:hypothetical protein n=1 Tax=Vreelandella titanicae TaxID=664683 RepID=UPI003D086E65